MIEDLIWVENITNISDIHKLARVVLLDVSNNVYIFINTTNYKRGRVSERA